MEEISDDFIVTLLREWLQQFETYLAYDGMLIRDGYGVCDPQTGDSIRLIVSNGFTKVQRCGKRHGEVIQTINNNDPKYFEILAVLINEGTTAFEAAVKLLQAQKFVKPSVTPCTIIPPD